MLGTYVLGRGGLAFGVVEGLLNRQVWLSGKPVRALGERHRDDHSVPCGQISVQSQQTQSRQANPL